MTHSSTVESARQPHRASVADTAAFIGKVVIPTIAKGVLIRRPRAVKLAASFDLDAGAVRFMQELRARYGEAPLHIRNPVREQVVLLSGDDVRTMLEQTPDPFTHASDEKYAALSHFEPHDSLATRGHARPGRRALQEKVLETDKPVHRLAGRFAEVVNEEAAALLGQVDARGVLTWDAFIAAWMRIVRRLVLGDEASDAHEVTDLLARLRYRGNWAFAFPKDRAGRQRLHDMLAQHLARAELDSLAGMAATIPHSSEAAPTHQMTQWLFAFDAGGIATYRTLALLALHSDHLARVRDEMAGGNPADLPYLRAAFIDCVRLFPTTPAILRQAVRDTELNRVTLRKGAGVLIFVPFFTRDDERIEAAHRFAPELWLHKDPGGRMPLVPFSAGPAICPGRHLVAMIASVMIVALIGGRNISTLDARLSPERLPGTFDHYQVRMRLTH